VVEEVGLVDGEVGLSSAFGVLGGQPVDPVVVAGADDAAGQVRRTRQRGAVHTAEH